MLEIGDVMTLSNNQEYIVMKQVCYQQKNYLYLVSKDGISEVAIFQLENNQLIKVQEEELLKILIERLNEE